MSTTFKFGNEKWAVGKETVLAYNDENNNFKPLPFTFDRGSTATVVNSDGLIETVGVDEPRIDFLNNSKGHLLLEPSRQNEVSTSDHNPNSYWGNQGSTFTNSSNTTTPDGGLTAPILTTTTTGAFKGITKVQATSWNDDTYTMSVFAKYIDSPFIFFYNINAVGGTNGVWFNISNGTVAFTQGAWSNAKIEDYGNGWYRCSATVTFNSSGTSYLYILNADGDADTSSTADKQCYLWGSQIELGSYATSYIPTSGSAVTRSAETCNGAGNNEAIPSDAGVFYFEGSVFDNGSNNIISLTDGGTSNYIYLNFQTGSDQEKIRYVVSGTSQINYSAPASQNMYNISKYAISYKTNEIKFYRNGSEITTDTSATMLSAKTLNEISFYFNNANNFYGKVKNIKLYNTALTDAELIALTTI